MRLIIALLIWIAAAPCMAQYYADPYLYYRIGGGKATAPTSLDPDIRFRFNSKADGFACGNFNPRLDVRSMLGGIGDSIADLGSLSSSITGALPGQILCRAQPSLCQLMQHYSVRAEDSWRFSVDACETLQQTASTGSNTHQDWRALRRAQEWERQAAAGADAATAHLNVSEEQNPCITWVEGKDAGCPGREPVRPVRDTVRAGWCIANGAAGDCSAAGSGVRDSTRTTVRNVWDSPNAAANYAADIVGDSEIADGGTPRSHTATGLSPKVEEEKQAVMQVLNEVLASGGFPDTEQADKLSAPTVTVTHQLVIALREVDAHGIYTERLAEEIALARVVEKALLARRLLLTGSSEPNIQAAGPASEAVTNALQRLEAEIDRIIFDYQVRRSLVSDTSVELLRAHARTRVPISPTGDIIPDQPPQ